MCTSVCAITGYVWKGLIMMGCAISQTQLNVAEIEGGSR